MSNTNQHSSLDELNETQKMQILLERVQAFTRLLLQERIKPGDLSYALSYVSAHMVLYLIKDQREAFRTALWGIMDGTRGELSERVANDTTQTRIEDCNELH